MRAERRRALMIRAALAVAVVVGIFVGWSALAHSTLFTIETITVEGARELSVEEVIAVADIKPADTLLGLDESAVVDRLEAVAWIADADVVRKFPSTILLRVEERERFLMIDAGDTFWALDRYGRVLGESMPDTATPVPLVRDVPTFTPEVGAIVKAPEVSNAIEVLAGITPELRAQVRSMSSPGPEETALMTTDHVEIMIGRAEQLREKSLLALEIMADQGSAVVFIDVRSLERPVSRGLGD
jgi:cell division protein FtsQ